MTVTAAAGSPSRRWLLSGAAILAGVVVGLGFQPTNLWWLVPVGVAGLVSVLLVSTPKLGLLRGYLFGLAFNAVAFQWVSVLSVAVVVVFALWLAVWYALVGLVVSLTRHTPAWGGVGVAAWMGAEWCGARWPFGGFGWGRLAYTAPDTPIDGLFPLISASGVSFLIVTTGFLIAWVMRGWVSALLAGHPSPWRAIKLSGVVALAVFLVVVGVTGWAAQAYDPAPDGQQLTVAVVQGNVPGEGVDAMGPRYTVENNHLAQTIILAARINAGEVPRPDLVIWPENSTTTDPTRDKTTRAVIETALDLVDVPILVGAITRGPGPDQRQTVGMLYVPGGEVTDQYAKRNLVPFGEWVPFRSFLVGIIPYLEKVGAQSVPGTEPGILDAMIDSQPLRLGDLICFEVSYDSTFDSMMLGDDVTGGGAQVIVVQTSNAMFTGSAQMAQQDQITRIRAMEARREILVATTNSLAGLIDSHGRIVYEAELGTSDAQVFTVPLRSQITPAVAYRGWFDCGVVVAPLLVGAGLGLRSRRSAVASPAHGPGVVLVSDLNTSAAPQETS